MITLKDIAKEANISIMTVSNVVNGNLSKVSKENADKIRQIIKKRAYVPNSTARNLAKSHSNIIAIILRSHQEENSLKNPHNAALVGTIIQKVQTLGYYTMLTMVDTQEDISNCLRTWNARGAVFLGMFDDEIEKIYASTDTPMVFIDSYSNVRQLSNVGIDDYKGGQLAAQCLIKNGHKNIAFVSPPSKKNGVIQHRLNGFSDTLEKNGLVLIPEHQLIIESELDQESVLQAAKYLAGRKDYITAVFVTSDQMAATLIQAVKLLGLSIPEDLSIIGFDNMIISMQISPLLTTISQDLDYKAALAVDILNHRLQNPEAPAESRILDVTLIERYSVKLI